jgi:hypothetical protein
MGSDGFFGWNIISVFLTSLLRIDFKQFFLNANGSDTAQF